MSLPATRLVKAAAICAGSAGVKLPPTVGVLLRVTVVPGVVPFAP